MRSSCSCSCPWPCSWGWFVADLDRPVLHPALGPGHPVGDEHPPAADAEVPAVADQTDEDAERQQDERDADDPAHGVVDGGGQELAAQDRRHPEDEDDEAVAGGVGRRHDESPSGTLLGAGEVGDGGEGAQSMPWRTP